VIFSGSFWMAESSEAAAPPLTASPTLSPTLYLYECSYR
jgi:hypothetical protein